MILIIDAGTTSIRGILYDRQGEVLFSSQKKSSPDFLSDHRVEQDPLVWKECLEEILRETGTFLKTSPHLAPGELQALGVTAFRSPVFPLDAAGKPLLPAIMWQDRRTDQLCESLSPHNDLVYERSGLPITSVFSGAKMRWIIEHAPEIYRKTWKFSGVFEYLLYLLTGDFKTDHSLASRTNLFNLESLQWDEELLALFGVRKELLAPAVTPGSQIGPLLESIARDAGLPAGIPVIAAGGDQQCAALGLGIDRPGKAALNTGTGAYLITISDKPARDPRQRLFTNLAAVPGRYIIETGLLTAGTIYRWFSETLFLGEAEEAERFRLIDSAIEASPPGSRGVQLFPDFKAADSPLGGCFLHLGLETGPGDMARAILEGIALEMEERMVLMEGASGRIDTIISSGGMSRFSTYNQILADIFERPVHCFGDGESTAFGAWINSCRAIGRGDSVDAVLKERQKKVLQEFQPREEHFKIYREHKRERRGIKEALSKPGAPV